MANQTASKMDEAFINEGGPSDLRGKEIEFDLAEELCDTSQDQCYVKDLSKLGRDLSKVIIVDNLPVNFAWQLKNGICIREYRVDGGSGTEAANSKSD